MRLLPSFLLLILFLLPASAASKDEITDKRLRGVDAIIEEAIQSKQIPGAVLLVGRKGEVIYRKAYGNRSLEPNVEPMTIDTIFDIASLTKPVATTTAVMQLFEQGRFRLNDPISKFIPEFGMNGKGDITIRQLMTHYSGLRPDVDLKQPWSGRDALWKLIVEEKLTSPPGTQFVYSDINYEMLGYLVEKIGGMPLDQFTAKHVFEPLKMKHTRFLPPAEWNARIAPTEYDENKRMLRGIVHDPTARRVGGVIGHAGVFSTADDLSRFAQALLDGDKFLSRSTIEKMTTPQQPPTATSLRGLGWDIDTPFSSNRGELMPIGSFGHTGFTGTSMWIDPYSKTYYILLANAVHPRGDVAGAPKIAIRTKVATLISAALELSVSEEAQRRMASITGYNETAVGVRRPVYRNAKVLNGIDVLAASQFKEVRGARELTRVGVLTNHTGLALDGTRTIDLLAKVPGIKLNVLFSPEHGATGQLDTSEIGNTVDKATGATVYSVYGDTEAKKRPSDDVMKQLDAVVIDIQDVGSRFYTYITSMRYFLESAAKNNVEIFILDRPNPITGTAVQGPISTPGQESFVNFHAVPVRHGMTMGELGKLMNAERNINAKLTVIPMQGWMRGDWFDSTNQMWINPSPNMRNLTQATLYTGVGLIEYANISVGRGTDTPFEIVGAPWIKGRELAEYLNARGVSGVRFVPVAFTPASSKFEKQLCEGVNMVVTDRLALDAPLLGVELASALVKLYPRHFEVQKLTRLLVNEEILKSIVAGKEPRSIADDWREPLEQFLKVREKYLIYK